MQQDLRDPCRALPDVWHAQISRGNNDANVLVLGAKVIDASLAEQVLDTWLTTPFKGGEHARRVAMIAALERGETLLGGAVDRS